jgi:hypothetical protein
MTTRTVGLAEHCEVVASHRIAACPLFSSPVYHDLPLSLAGKRLRPIRSHSPAPQPPVPCRSFDPGGVSQPGSARRDIAQRDAAASPHWIPAPHPFFQPALASQPRRCAGGETAQKIRSSSEFLAVSSRFLVYGFAKLFSCLDFFPCCRDRQAELFVLRVPLSIKARPVHKLVCPPATGLFGWSSTGGWILGGGVVTAPGGSPNRGGRSLPSS